MQLIAIPDWVNTWLTPLWLMGLGSLAGLLALSATWGLVWLISRRRANEVLGICREGVLPPLLWMAGAFALMGVMGTFLVRDSTPILASLVRLPFTGQFVVAQVVPAAEDDEAEPPWVDLPAAFRGDELRSIQVLSANDAEVRSHELLGEIPAVQIDVTGGETRNWERVAERGDLLDGIRFSQLQARNLGDRPAEVRLVITTAPQHPQATTVFHVAAAVIVAFLVYLVMRLAFPKMSAISLATAKSQMAQPLYLILLGLGFFLLALFIFVPYHTFGEDIKVLKDSGLTLILVFSVLQAVWAASTSVEDEIEGKTALTVLSKPVGRRQFILGKFFGISWASVVFIAALGAWLLILVSYKAIYDARETSNPTPEWQESHVEMMRTIPGLALALMETLVFISISVEISTRLPLLANMTICFAIYAFGHLTAQLVQAGEGRLENVEFMAQFIATVLPELDHFNISAAIAKGIDVPMAYVLTAAVYCILYCTMALLLAFVLFEDRDLA